MERRHFHERKEVNRTHSTQAAGLLRALGGSLGLLQADPKVFLQSGSALDAAAIQERIANRATAKAAGDYALADSIRKSLQEQGIVLKDTARGTSWEAVK